MSKGPSTAQLLLDDRIGSRDLLPRIQLPPRRWRSQAEFPEDFSQENESLIAPDADSLPEAPPRFTLADAGAAGYASYQLIRNVLAAYATESSFCVVHDARRPDLREEWFRVMSAVKDAEMRVRLKVITWQELAALLPDDLQNFLDLKYGITAPERTPASLGSYSIV